MADDKDLLEFCPAGNSPDSSGPPIKRLRGGNGGEESSMGSPGFEDGAGLQPGDESQPGGSEDWGLCPSPHLAYFREFQNRADEGASSNSMGSRLVSGGLEATLGTRDHPLRQETRTGRPQVARGGDLWDEPSAFFDVAEEALDLADEGPNPSDNLQWARKSQRRQTRTSSRLPLEGPDFLRDRVPESPFRWCSPPPPALPSSPPSEVFQFGRGITSPPRMRPVMRSGRGGGGPVRPGESRRFNPWDDIWEPEDELLDLGMVPSSSRTGPSRQGRGPGRPSSAATSRLCAPPSSETFGGGFFGPPASGDGGDGAGFPSMTQRPARGMDTRRAALLHAAREQQTREAMQRHRTQRAHRIRERRASLREEFGALINVLGIFHAPEGGSARAREPRNSMVAMHEAVMGIARSGLPPHLLFSDRDFTPDDYDWLCRLDEGVENRKGADDDTINKLPTITYTEAEFPEAGGNDEGGEEVDIDEDEQEGETTVDPERRCPICLDSFDVGDMLRVMPCKHKYHKDCLDRWLKIKATCPICNLNIKGE